MNLSVVLLVIGIVGAIIFLSRKGVTNKRTREEYLRELADFLEAKVENLSEQENSYKIEFVYQNQPFVYEDIEDVGFKEVHYKAFLKGKTESSLNLSFIERARDAIRSDVQSFAEIASSPWGRTSGEVQVPKALKEFSVLTNHPGKANELLGDEQVVGVFSRFKSVGLRGHPVMSLEIQGGVVLLRFHPPGGLRPSIFNVQSNVTSIENYMNKLIIVMDKIKQNEDKGKR